MSEAAKEGLTRAELLAFPVVVDVTTAARALGLGRSTAYELVRRDEFPCRVLRVGSSYRIPMADLLRVLGIDPASGQDPAPKSAALSLPRREKQPVKEPIRKIELKDKTVRYRLVVDAGYDENGKRQQLTRTFDKLKEARAELSRIRHETDKGTFVKPSEITVNQ